MKRLCSVLLGLFMIFNLITPTFAEDSTTTSSGDYTLQTQVDETTTKATNKYFDLTISRGLQSPIGKSILYTITIVPHIDSTKVQIQWDSASSVNITPWHSEYVNMTANQLYSYKAVVHPTIKGTYSITVTTIAWQYDTNYTNSVTDTLELNSNLVAMPITPEYTISVVIEVLLILAVSGTAVYFGIKYTKKLLKKTKVWLTPPM